MLKELQISYFLWELNLETFSHLISQLLKVTYAFPNQQLWQYE